MPSLALSRSLPDMSAQIALGPNLKIDHHHHHSQKAPVSDALQPKEPYFERLRRKLSWSSVVTAFKGVAWATGGTIATFSIALNFVPVWVLPSINAAAAAVHLQGIYEGVTNEPRENAPDQGTLRNRMKFAYEFQLMGLDHKGGVMGRFRTDASSQANVSEPDAEWWQLRGISDGKAADLTISDTDGFVLGNIHIVKDSAAEGSIWAGHITAYDTSVSKEGLVQSPILINPNIYDAKSKTLLDPYLNEPSVLVKPHLGS